MDLETYKIKILSLKDKLYRFSYSMLQNKMEAEDVIQEVMIKIWNQKDRLDHIENLEAWCIRVTKNMTIDKLRSSHYKRMTKLPEGTDWKSKDESPDRNIELKDAVDKIKLLIAQLPENQKMVIHLRDIEQLSYKEIAEVLEMSMEQVKVNLHRARQKVRLNMMKQYNYGIKNN